MNVTAARARGGARRRRGAGVALACAMAIGAAAASFGAAAGDAVPAAAPDAPGAAGAGALWQAARADYILQCAGCHRVDGRGSTPHGIPDFRNSVGAFTHLPAGREYLIRVPGAAYSQLNNAELANVLNWLLHTFSPAQLPAGFRPYTESEVAAARPRRYDDVVPVRHGLARELGALGFALSDYSYGSARKP
ncbi:c-type cytochrome [Achromobacter xylosoxidans]|uniref:c-type cytochrome n=1 Tax=Alcaligenes xylosoxydans xylosoxydans TaxID=85698 RepID=UPI0005D99547|nr:Cytochrome c552 [Achromobacter xylosoxidans]CUJ20255.1 Cytochrome c552 [Achromobacter xylosoxidans]CUJ62181.1 Cytochrome c552 [Achromobacter xylosoxidans]CUJ91759.1 Cytochrome c552 [Achromobacter xylosoxidans]CUR80143.1 Cytochrome c552 [Achromobacter xylosoxidans]